MNPVTWFIERINHYMSGKGSPIILIVVWWALLNAVSFGAGATLAGALGADDPLHIGLRMILAATGLLGFIIAFIYPFILVVSVWRCALNVQPSWAVYAVRLLLIPMIAIQLHMSLMYSIGATALLGGALG